MDPKTFAKLDPKLRETYERVMGTSVPQKPTIVPGPQSPPPSSPTQPVVANPAVQTTPAPTEHSSTPLPTTTSTEPVPIVSTATTHSPLPVEKVPMHSTIAVHTAVATPTSAYEEKKETHESTGSVPAWKKILFIVLGIAFFSTYAIFWLIYFKVQLPF